MNTIKGSNILIIFLLLAFAINITNSWCLNSQMNQYGPVVDLDYSSDNKYMLTVSTLSKTVYFWNILTKNI